jgi:DNA-binding MarR family transcriptional regulator
MALPAKDVVETETKSFTLLLDAATIAERALEKRLGPLKLTVSQQRILGFVFYARESVTPSMLAGLVLQETHSISGLLNRLEDRHLITRTHDNQDRRVVWVGLTPAGRDVAEKGIEISLQVAREFNDIFNAPDGEVVRSALQEVRDLGFRLTGVREDVRQEALRRVFA